ncbi:MAG: protein translocase subunit SecD, partial [Opitutae bacterium]|nr:protein translocase subunit SecD [Opitutae bacterium]
MTKSTIWKLIFIFFIVLVSFSLISPFEDRELGEYAESQAGTTADPAKYPDHVSFSDITTDVRAGLEEGQDLNFESLRNYGKENKLDYSAYFQPPEGVLNTIFSRLLPFWINPGIRAGHVKDRDKRNDLVLRTLLTNSQAAIKLGLDLRGGIAFTMEARDLNASSDEGDPSGSTAMDKVVEIMNERLNAFGVAETVVQKKGDRAIEIKIPDRTTKQNPGMIEDLQRPAKLEFRIVNVDSSARQPTEENEDWTNDEGILYRSMTRSDAEPNENPIWVQQLSSADGDIVKEAFPRQDQMGGWEVGLDFTKEGGEKFGILTGDIAQMSDPITGADGRLAIVLDGQLESAPTVKQRIDGGSAVISGNFSYREAKLLSDILNNPLKVSLEIGEKYEVSPTLATSALDSSLTACYVGAFLVIAFMILWYKAGGFVAVFSVGTNVLLVVALLAGIFQATFTLPGMAALVLTIGMAVDANILIFERIREELKSGKSSENALEGGYAKAFSTIIDANLTTLITATILIWLGTGPVKGFGVTLAIGIVTSVFCALFISKTLLRLLLQTGLKNLISLRPIEKKKTTTEFDFLKYRNPAFLISWLIVGIGLFSVYQNQDKILGIDFRGGEELVVSFDEMVDPSDIDELFSLNKDIGEVQHVYRSEVGTGEG